MRIDGLLTAALAALLLDHASKQLVLSRRSVETGGAIRRSSLIRVVNNAKIAPWLSGNRRALVICWAVTVIAIILLAQLFAPMQEPLVQFAVGAAIGGATGNLLDVLRRDAVVDFIDLRIGPVFNVADVAIVVGVTLTVWSTLNF